MSKKIEKLKESTEAAIWQAVEMSNKLHRALDRALVLSAVEEGRFLDLGNVVQLLEIASDLFPYHKED